MYDWLARGREQPSHYFMIDRPLVDAHGFRIENLHPRRDVRRPGTETNENHWVKVLVDPKSRDVFAFQPQTVPANPVPYTP